MDLLAIPDCVLSDLPAASAGGLLLSEDSHLLRRFGEIALLSKSGDDNDFHVRQRADELLIPIKGELKIELVDVRKQSPTSGQRTEVVFAADDGKLLLIPYGVAYRVSGSDAALTLRVSTHADRDKDAHLVISPKDLAAGWMLGE